MIYKYWGTSYDISNVKNPFSDVKKSDGYYNAIMYAYDAGIIKGYDDGTFRPKNNCTRGQIATILYKMAGSPKVDLPSKSPFSDVKTTDGYYKPIVWAYQQGIIKGYSNGTFRPKNDCTRSQFCTMLYRFNETVPNG